MTKVTITSTDYGFEAPATITGGTVEISFTNGGRELHFAGLGQGGAGQDL